MYHIISINDDRKYRKAEIRAKMAGMEEVSIPSCDPLDAKDFAEQVLKHDIRITITDDWQPLVGEVGVWYSHLNIWRHMIINKIEQLVVFEDDATVNYGAVDIIQRQSMELPNDYDVLALSVPFNQLQDFEYRVAYDNLGRPLKVMHPNTPCYVFDVGLPTLARVYQGYGCVAMMYSLKGAKRLYDLAIDYGMSGPVDCWIYEHAHAGRLEAYAPKPTTARAASDAHQKPTQIHNTERFLYSDWKIS